MEPSATAATGYPPGEGVPANATGKQSPDSGAFTLERPANRRLKKAPIVLLVVAVGVLLVVTLYLALRPVSRADSASVTAQVDSEAVKRAIPDALKLSERDFMPVKPDVPPLGPPLAGDLGGLQLKPALPLPAPVVTPAPRRCWLGCRRCRKACAPTTSCWCMTPRARTCRPAI